jgi:probable F420-dependent oxidoreductase
LSAEFGISTTGWQGLPDKAVQLEDMGFDCIGVGEHIFFHVPTANPLIALAAAAAVTSRIRLMTSVLLLPLYPPALLAKMATTLDVVSHGRLMLGVGVGGEYPAEFEACGVPMRERGARADEALTILKALWTQDEVNHAGRWSSLSGVHLDPGPVQVGGPPIWVSGRSKAAVRRAARFGSGFIPYLCTAEAAAASYAELDALAAEAGRPGAVKQGVLVFVSCHEDPAVARAQAVSRLSRQYDQDFEALVDKYVCHGTPVEVVTSIGCYVEAGASLVMLAHACAEEDVAQHEQVLARDVLPALRRLWPDPM